MIEKKLDIKGFQSPNGNGSYRPFTLNILAFGQEGAGKSRFIATMPDPIGGLILDMKSETSIRRAVEESGKVIVWPDPAVTARLIHDEDIRTLRLMTDDQFKEHYRKRVDLMTDLLMELCHHKDIRSIFIDPFYQLAAEIKLAQQGRKQKVKAMGSGKVFQDNDAVYQECIKLLNRINVKHTLLSFKHKDEYVNDSKTGRSTWDHGAFKYIGNHTNCAIELQRNPKAKPTVNDWRYRLNVRNCLANETLQGAVGLAEETGLVDEAISFENLARAIFSDVDEEALVREFA